jgi:hypothetical protein
MDGELLLQTLVVHDVLHSLSEPYGDDLPRGASELDNLERTECKSLPQQSRAPTILLEIIKHETRLWVAAGAKHLSYVILGE